MSKSIVTLQLGNYSNFIGSHFWNLHEFSFENSNNNYINIDVNYYEGLTTNNNVTFTPKVISWDWKENLGPRIIDDIYEEIENQGVDNPQSRREINSLKVNSYKGKVEVNTGFSEEELSVNKTSDIRDKNYKEWNEYLYARFHPNSLTKLPKLYRNMDSGNFRNFSQGLDLTQTREYFDRMEDQTRYFVEKCDVLQGFQIVCDVDDGFSGVAMNFLNQLSDEYSKDIISFPTSKSTDNDVDNVFNKIFLYNEMNCKSIFWSPISVSNPNASAKTFPNVDYDCRSDYQSSAILALALKSLLLPCFLNSNIYTLADFGSVVDKHTNNLASLATALPFPLALADTVENSLANVGVNDCFTVLNPHVDTVGRFDALLGNVFGVDDRRGRNVVRTSRGRYDQCSTVAEMLETFVNADGVVRNCRFVQSPGRIELRPPFPAMFSANVDRFSGELLAQLDGRAAHLPKSIPLSTVLFAGDSADYLLPLYQSADTALKSRRLSSLMMELEPDYLSEAVENFRAMI